MRRGGRGTASAADAAADASLLDHSQRRLLLGVCLVTGAATTIPASYNYVLVPMLTGLGASESQSSLLRQLPGMAGLLVIFLSGILGHRWGERRFIMRCAILFTAGNATVAAAPGMAVAALGLILESIGASGFIVVALALLSARVSNDQARASAFATYAIAGPVVYLTVPLLAGLIVDHASWRLMVAIWAASGVVIWLSAWIFLPARDSRRDGREFLTPALAGVVLAATVQTISAADRDGFWTASTLVRLGIALVAFVALLWVRRRIADPTLSLAALRHGGMSLLLIIVILMSFANLWFYLTIGFEYIYGLDALQTAVAMLPAQAAGIGGAVLTRALLRRLGITTTGLIMLLALALALLASATITADAPIWIPIVIMSGYAAASVGAGIPLTNAVMNLAPPGEDGSTSAFRSAAGNIGSAVGVVVMSTIVFGVFSASLASGLRSHGLESRQSTQIAQKLLDGATSEEVSANYSVPLQRVSTIANIQREAMADGLRAHGLSGAAFTGVCLVIFYFSRRREPDSSRRRDRPRR